MYVVSQKTTEVLSAIGGEIRVIDVYNAMIPTIKHVVMQSGMVAYAELHAVQKIYYCETDETTCVDKLGTYANIAKELQSRAVTSIKHNGDGSDSVVQIAYQRKEDNKNSIAVHIRTNSSNSVTRITGEYTLLVKSPRCDASSSWEIMKSSVHSDTAVKNDVYAEDDQKIAMTVVASTVGVVSALSVLGIFVGSALLVPFGIGILAIVAATSGLGAVFASFTSAYMVYVKNMKKNAIINIDTETTYIIVSPYG